MEGRAVEGWEAVLDRVGRIMENLNATRIILSVECYHGTDTDSIAAKFTDYFQPDLVVRSEDAFLPSEVLDKMMYPDITDDRVFGHMTRLNLIDLFDEELFEEKRASIQASDGLVLVIGTGASLLCENPDLLIYADMARWEIQQRMRRGEVGNLGAGNTSLDIVRRYKRAYFIDWRICDRLKKALLPYADFILDTNINSSPKLVEGEAVLRGLANLVTRPFRVVPFFDPGPWGGQWMKDVCDLDRTVDNFAWCFDCVPEENSLLMQFGEVTVELPASNLTFMLPRQLLGGRVYARFGDEFPIRFDFLDTMAGGNLSLQVHPLTEYIQEHFGMHYTQDESYYLLDAGDDAVVYLGLKEDVDARQMVDDLRTAQAGGAPFDDEKYVEKWPAKKHDHFLIPAGTVHCSGKNSMVLEISATPYIFTFKLWDWGRLGLDGLPRPIHIERGKDVIQWDRTTAWTRDNLINRIEEISDNGLVREERTGLHEYEFIETRRHWFTGPVEHDTGGSVNVLNLVEGREVVVESPDGAFEPFVVHYAETFIVPAEVGSYTIRPYGESEGKTCATIKAFVKNRKA